MILTQHYPKTDGTAKIPAENKQEENIILHPDDSKHITTFQHP
jgi:hypothetical protein